MGGTFRCARDFRGWQTCGTRATACVNTPPPPVILRSTRARTHAGRPRFTSALLLIIAFAAPAHAALASFPSFRPASADLESVQTPGRRLQLSRPGAVDPEGDVRTLTALYSEAQQRVERAWKYDPALLCGSAGVYGLVEKRATRLEMPDLGLLKSRGVKLPAGIPLYAGPTIFISKKYQFIYVRQQKSSSSAIIAAITRTFCGGTGVCTDDEFRWETMPRSITEDTWREYFVFTWVRNPWVRMESSYRFLCEKLMRLGGPEAPQPGPPCCPGFLEFAADPHVLVDMCERDTCCAWNEWATPPKWDFRFIPGHLNDQAHITFATSGEAMVDFIGRTEHTDEDWATLLQHIGNRTGWHFEAQAPDRRNWTPDDPSSGHYVDCLERNILYLDEPAMREIARVFAMDILRFGFGAPPATISEQDSGAARLSSDDSAAQETASSVSPPKAD